jgi:hypothetical protein
VVVEVIGSPLGYRVALLGTGTLTLLALLTFLLATRRRHDPAPSRRVA